ncbi:MAG: hypothetical protein HC915_04570 [Anaerolineae bacterium]|nr:hypothetical protein [Anaerolineae bacterium]
MLYFWGLGVLYIQSTPPFEAPDESSHFLYIHNWLETGQLPVLEDRATVLGSGSAQRHHPPLYYGLGALLIAGTDRNDLEDYLLLNPAGAPGVLTLGNQNVFLHSPTSPSAQTSLAIRVLRSFSLCLAAGRSGLFS